MPLQQSHLPKAGTLADWTRILGISAVTLTKYIRLKKLKAERKLNGQWRITRAAVCECFDIKE